MRRHGFTLFEVMLGALVVVIGIIAIVAVLPVGVRAQQMARYRMYANAFVLSALDTAHNTNSGFAGKRPNKEWGNRRNAESNVTWNDPAGANAKAFIAGTSVGASPAWSPKSTNDFLDYANNGENYNTLAQDLTVHTRPSPINLATYAPGLETRIVGADKSLWVVPPVIARRLDSEGDEIQRILDDGGDLYYLAPWADLGRNSDISLLNSKAVTGQPSEAQKLVFAIVGPRQQFALNAHPFISFPYYDWYPHPPRKWELINGRRIANYDASDTNGKARLAPAPSAAAVTAWQPWQTPHDTNDALFAPSTAYTDHFLPLKDKNGAAGDPRLPPPVSAVGVARTKPWAAQLVYEAYGRIEVVRPDASVADFASKGKAPPVWFAWNAWRYYEAATELWQQARGAFPEDPGIDPDGDLAAAVPRPDQVLAMSYLAHAAMILTIPNIGLDPASGAALSYPASNEAGPALNWPPASAPAAAWNPAGMGALWSFYKAGGLSPIALDPAKAAKLATASMKYAIRYARDNPYDWGAPRPANSPCVMDAPLLAYDMTSTSGPLMADTAAEPLNLDFLSWYQSGNGDYKAFFWGWGTPNNRDQRFQVTAWPLFKQNAIPWQVVAPSTIANAATGSATVNVGYYPGKAVSPMVPDPRDQTTGIEMWKVRARSGMDTVFNQTVSYSNGLPAADWRRQVLTRPFAAGERSRQIVCWAVDWQSYQDAEVVPSAAPDISAVQYAPEPTPSYWNDDLKALNSETFMTWLKDPRTYTGDPDTQTGDWPKRWIDAHPDARRWSLQLPTSGYSGANGVWGKFGADRNANGRFDRGPTKPSVRLRAVEVGRWNYYEPVGRINLRN